MKGQPSGSLTPASSNPRAHSAQLWRIGHSQPLAAASVAAVGQAVIETEREAAPGRGRTWSLESAGPAVPRKWRPSTPALVPVTPVFSNASTNSSQQSGYPE